MKTIRILTAAVMISAVSAFAVPTLQLTDLNNLATVLVTDQVAPDVNPTQGAVTYVGAVGANWTINVSTGLGMPALGTPFRPEMDLNSINTSQNKGSIQILFSDVGYTTPIPEGFVISIGGTTPVGATVTYNVWADGVNNALFGMQTLLGTYSYTAGAQGFSGNLSGVYNGQNPYSLTLEVIITHPGAGVTSFDAHLNVPDSGTTVTLLGAALTCLALIRRRFVR